MSRYDVPARIRNICGVMGWTPADVRALTPADTALLIEGWNEAHGEGGDAYPTRAEHEELMAKYG